MSIDALKPVRLKTRSDESTELLRAAIRNGSLPPGTRLIEQDLAKMLQVSRVPIREAIQRLAEEGLVRKIPHRGAFVYKPSIEEIEEIWSLRVVLERFVVERAIAHWQPEHERKLRQIVANMQEAANHNDYQLVYEEDYNFHHTLWEIADHSILIEVVSGLRSRINHFLYQAASTLPAEELSEHVDGHYNLIELFQQGDIHLAQQKIDDHITRARDRILLHCDFESSTQENMD